MENMCGSGFRRAIINPNFLPIECGFDYESFEETNKNLKPIVSLENGYKKNSKEFTELLEELMKPKSIHFVERNGTTTVKWKDGTITTVKCGEDDVFDKEKGVALCFMKKKLGNTGVFNEVLKEWCY